jgi:hypothetical protein
MQASIVQQLANWLGAVVVYEQYLKLTWIFLVQNRTYGPIQKLNGPT